jgi:hypothetical protein
MKGWVGLDPSAEDSAHFVFGKGGEAVFRYPDGPRGWVKYGFRLENDGTENWGRLGGLHLEVYLDGSPVRLTVEITSAQPETVTAVVSLTGTGWQTLFLPWSAFAFDQSRTYFLHYIKELRLTMKALGGGDVGQIGLRHVRVVGGEKISLECAVLGKSAEHGQSVHYEARVANCSDSTLAVTLLWERYGWEAMTAVVEPEFLTLGPGESRAVQMQVQVPERVPPGGQEKQTLRAIPNGDGTCAASLTFITASSLPHPYLLHTPERWQEVSEKVRAYAWAGEGLADYVARAEAYTVPQPAEPPENDPDDTMGPFLFETNNEKDLMACGIAWQLTNERKYAEKIALFLRRLSDPETGYPVTLRGCNQGLVQEGHFFQHLAMAYDMALTADVFSPDDRQQIAQTFRLFLETIDLESRAGGINNWIISEVVGAFYCALALQDLAAAERFFAGPGGILEQVSKGTMDDGWWYECSISYNLWCAAEFCQVALAWEPWGVNFRDMRIPASYALEASLSASEGKTELSGGNVSSGGADINAMRRPFGMSKEIWGPIRRPWREIRDLWNGLLPFMDYRGVIFGVNDSTERSVYESTIGAADSRPFEIAYYVYRDPAYAAMVKHGEKRDLLYGVPELPENTPELFRDSGYADNVGVAMLRSQTADRPSREQIQAVLHYGTHGWAHGHFDRTGLLSLMRFGRSFFSPESVFYIYEPFMYKFYCQCSISQNMVTVDQKMQEAAESWRLLFHSGPAMQVAVVETDTRWSDPPYGGMVYSYVPVKTFEEKCWREGRSVPIPDDAPEYGTLGRFTEKILQRRVLIVTDDYVVLADYLRGEQPHTFDNLLQMKGFQSLESAEITHVRHDAQWNTDPCGSAQFVTDCDWYAAQAPSQARFEMHWGPGADNEGTYAPFSEDGVLKLDVHSLWPLSQEIMVGTAPEPHDTQKRLFYTVRGDGEALAEGKFGAWILGQSEIDVSVEGMTRLELETRVELSLKPTVFWGDARITTGDGREISLSELPIKMENLVQPPQPGLDYYGGPIKIAGDLYRKAVPGQPEDTAQPAFVRVDLRGLDAVRFRATLGGDYPLGDEQARRKTFAVRSEGKDARFLTLIEPYEDRPVIRSAEALGADGLRVTLVDGRVQEIKIRNLEGSGRDISVRLVESRGDETLRVETT